MDDLPEDSGSVQTEVRGPISRETLVRYAGASGDFVPLHYDSEFAQTAGYDDVFAHGMLVMAYLGQTLTNAHRPEDIREFSVRFKSVTPVKATLKIDSTIFDAGDGSGSRKVGLSGEVDGVKVIEGYAIINSGN